jgi:general secretion pathway protein G
MNDTTTKELLKIAGKVLFVIGLIGVVFSLLVGFWPGAGAILLMLSGALMVALGNSMFDEGGFNQVGTAGGTALRSLLDRVDVQKLKRAVRIIALSIALFFVVVIALFIFGQNYFKARDTKADQAEIVAALNAYRQANSAYPDNLTTLVAKNPLRSTWLHDHWGNGYQYAPFNNGTGFTLRSAGKDGKFETGDDLVVKN